MKGVGKKLLAVFLACAMMLPMTVSALAMEEEKEINNTDPLAVTSDGQSIDFEKSYNYGLSNAEDPYFYLSELLESAEVFYENESLGVKTYSLEISKELPIENAAEFVEIGKWDDVFSITYYSDDGEFVILQYLPDGTINTYVRNEEITAEAEEPEVSLVAFYGEGEEVVEFDPSPEISEKVTAAAKKVEFPTPVECGHRDTGPDGIVATTQRVYIDQLRQDFYVRVMEVESNYKKQGGTFKTWAANTTIAAISLKLALPTLGLGLFLAAAGVAMTTYDGVKALAESVQLPNYTDYTASDGKNGDIYDTTVYNEYCRVYYNTGVSKYIAGVLGDGTFNYVKKGYTGIKTNDYIINKVADNFNTCIATNGSNTMYFPVE